MPITIVLEESRLWCPVAICDGCGERIVNAGNIEWFIDAETGDVIGPLYATHSDWGCCKTLEQRVHEDAGRFLMNMNVPLDAFLYQLVGNANITWDEKRLKARAALMAL